MAWGTDQDIVFWMLVIAAFLTAFYTARQIVQERIATVQEADIVEALVHFAKELQDEIRAERGEGKPEVVGA